MSHQPGKFENPGRLAELNPIETLRKIGLGEHDVVCDIGAGSGIFTIPAAKLTSNSVFALDINDEFLEIIKEKAKVEELPNIKSMKVAGDHYNYDIEAEAVDLVILVTVFHEIANKDALLDELQRIIKKTGKIAIIDFHKRQTPMGPPVLHRIDREEVIELGAENGFVQLNEFDLGNNFYCIILVKD